MARNNRWANHRLLTACLALSRADFTARRTGFFSSLHATLQHNLAVDCLYLGAMEHGAVAVAPPDCPTPALLLAAQTTCDLRLVSLADRLDVEALARIVPIQRPDRIQHERLDRLLLHLFQHQIHHRGQAHAMLSGTRVTPPQLDEFFLEEEAPLRAAEFAELGWSERIVWGEG